MGYSPLHIAAGLGHVEVVAALLDNGANIEGVGCGDMTPLYQAVLRNQPETVLALLERGASINALHCATAKGNVELMALLRDAGAE